MDAPERDRHVGSEGREALPDVDGPWGCTVARSFGQGLSAGSFAGTVRDQRSAMAASDEFEAPEPRTSVETMVWNRLYLLETVHSEGATGELAAANAAPGWKMGMVAAGSEQSGSDVAKEASLRSAPMSER